MLKNITEYQPDNSKQSSKRKELEKSLKTAMFRLNPTARYRVDVKAFFTPDIMT